MGMKGGEEVEGWSGGAGTLLKMPPSSSASIEYHSQFGSHDDILLLEVDDKLLPDILHNRVTVRGQPDEEAVLCTPSTTYALKFVGTSNSVFLIPDGDPSPMKTDSVCSTDVINNTITTESVASVLKVAPGCMELTQVAPRLDKLKYLLNERPYRPEEEDDMEDGADLMRGLYRWQDLTDLIQASDEELMAGLKALAAVEIDGFWRIVDEKVMGDFLKMILSNSIIHDWPLNALREDKVLTVLEIDGFSRKIVLHCLMSYGSQVDCSDGGYVWALDEKRVCLHFAKQVLGGGKMKLENFLERWRSSVPSGMHADQKILEGEALYENIGTETWIRTFSVSALPSTPAERFAALFQERLKWEGKDLQPYIRDLRVPGVSSEGLLIKYTRRTQPTGDAEPIFSAR